MPEPFSLLLPVYRGDRADFLAAAFASSVAEQHRRPDEVVLVQDGPVGEELAAEIARIAAESPVPVVHVVLPQNQGLARALMRGLEAASFGIVARMDADDISYPDRFAVQVPMIESGLDLVGSAMDEFVAEPDGGIRTVGTRTPPQEHDAIVARLPFHNPFNHPSVVYRTKAVLAAGGYEPLGTMEDYWLWGRMIVSGARTANTSRPLVGYRTDAGAYARRGGRSLLRTELQLQRAFRAAGITTRGQQLRNIIVRGGYRLIPESLRRIAYRSVFVGAHDAGRRAL